MNNQSKDTVDYERIKYLTPEELGRLLSAAKESVRDYAMLVIGYTHGLRASELCILKLEYWNEKEGKLYIRRVKNGLSNSYKVTDETARALKAWIEQRGIAEGPMFLTRNNRIIDADTKFSTIKFKSRGKETIQEVGMSRKYIDMMFKLYATKAKIPEDKRHFHVLRHSIAVHMVDRDIPFMRIKDWLGHRSIMSTMVYAQVSNKSRDNTHSLLGETVPDEHGNIVVPDSRKREAKKLGVNWSKDRRRK